MEFIYPARFEKAEEGGFIVTFPDFVGAITEGDSLREAFDMAEDCLGGLLLALKEEKMTIPNPSELTAFPKNSQNEFYSLIKVDLAEYKKLISGKPVRKTVYIPKGLNDQAELHGINFSKLLREALTNELSDK